jgi:AAA domain
MPLAEITNLRSAKRVYQYLQETKQPERIAIFYGKHGLGKSKSLELLQSENNGVYLYCLPEYSPRTFIEDILDACNIEPKSNRTAMIKQAIEFFGDTKRTLFLDDCDNIASGKLPEIVRAIHDRAQNIVIMGGMERFVVRLSKWPQLLDRSHKLKFNLLSIQDVIAIAQLSPVTIERPLIDKIFAVSEGKARLATWSIGYVNEFAMLREMDCIGVSDWGNQSLLPPSQPIVVAGIQKGAKEVKIAA